MEDKKTEDKPKEPEPSLTFLEEVRKERENLEKVREDNQKIVNEMKELQAEKIISGNIDAGKTDKPKEQMSNKDYAESAMRGEIPDAD